MDQRPSPVGFSSQPVRSLHHSFGLPTTAGLAWRPVHATDADFFRQEVPFLVADREDEWDSKARESLSMFGVKTLHSLRQMPLVLWNGVFR